MSGLAAQEKHGKREDRTSQKRKVRNAAPLIAGGLDLRALYDEHMRGVKQNSAAKKPVLHFIVRFPPELFNRDAKHFHGSKKERQQMMLKEAIAFINKTHGGHAVFAARLDRDEAGETIADVFAAPRYEKRTKRTKPDEKGQIWSSATKFGKELAMKHQEEIQRRHPEAKGTLLSPRAVGIALNVEWRSWFERINQLDLSAKTEKERGAPDRLETEAYKELQDQKAELSRIAIFAEKVLDELADWMEVDRGKTLGERLRRLSAAVREIISPEEDLDGPVW